MLRKLGKMALVAGTALAAAGQARADFSYSAAFTINSVTANGNTLNSPGVGTTTGSGITIVNTALTGSDGTTAGGGTATFGGTTLTLLDVNPTLTFTVPTPVPDTINIGNVGVNSTQSNATPDSFTVRYTDAVTVNNLGNPGTVASGTFDLTGTLTLTLVSGVPGNTGNVSNVFDLTSATGPLGGVLYMGQAVNFSNLTINAPVDDSNFGGIISAAPEPSTLALIGVGGLLLLAPMLRRKARVAA